MKRSGIRDPPGPDVTPAPEIPAGSLGERAGIPGTRSRIQKTIRVMSPESLLTSDYLGCGMYPALGFLGQVSSFSPFLVHGNKENAASPVTARLQSEPMPKFYYGM
jgi:hypothetical protein